MLEKELHLGPASLHAFRIALLGIQVLLVAFGVLAGRWGLRTRKVIWRRLCPLAEVVQNLAFDVIGQTNLHNHLKVPHPTC